jgi:hypothetical protein
MAFENNWRRQQELRLRPVADKYYSDLFGKEITVNRFEKEDDFILDKEFAMDVKITFSNGLILTGQEKFLSAKYSSFQSVTVEYMQDPKINEPGDWFKLGVQFYFVGYANQTETGFYPWVMLDWTATVLATNNGELEWISNKNKDGHAKASFVYIPMQNIPEYCVIGGSFNG